MSESKGALRKQKLVAPFNATAGAAPGGLGIGLEVAGNKVRRGHKVPEKYAVAAPPSATTNFARQASPDRVRTAGLNATAPNQFDTYMQFRMVNPDLKATYKDVGKTTEEFQKVTSKPFQTQKGRIQSASKKQVDAAETVSAMNGSVLSEGSTHLTAAISGKNRQESQDMAILEQEMYGSVTKDQAYHYQASVPSDAASQQQQLKPALPKKQTVKLSELARAPSAAALRGNSAAAAATTNSTQKDPFDSNLRNSLWKINEPVAQQNYQKLMKEKAGKIRELETYLKTMHDQKKLPAEFDNLVTRAVVRLKEQDDAASQVSAGDESAQSEVSEQLENSSKMFDYEEYQREDADMRALDLEIADREVQEQQQKWKRLNQMLEESADSISNMSVEDIKSRALFITDIGRQSNRFKKSAEEELPPEAETVEEQNEDEDVAENRKAAAGNNGYFIELNKRLAWMKELEKLDFHSKCDKLPEEAKKRLEELLADIEQFTDVEYVMQRERERVENPYQAEPNADVEQRIQAHLRELGENVNLQEGVLDENVLPKDKALRDEAAERILREKIEYVNTQLLDLAKNEKSNQVDKIKVRGLCERLREQFEYLPSDFLEHKRKEFDELRALHEQSLKKLEELSDQATIVKELEAVKQHLEYHLQRVKREGIVIIVPAEGGDQQSAGASSQSPEEKQLATYKQFKTNYARIQDMYQQLQKDEEALMQKCRQLDTQLETLENKSQMFAKKVYTQNGDGKSQGQQDRNDADDDDDENDDATALDGEDDDGFTLKTMSIDLSKYQRPSEQDLSELDRQIELKLREKMPDLFKVEPVEDDPEPQQDYDEDLEYGVTKQELEAGKPSDQIAAE